VLTDFASVTQITQQLNWTRRKWSTASKSL